MSAPSIVPLHIFRFRVDVMGDSLSKGPQGSAVQMSFAECTGLEATMEPKTIKEGGRNYGAAQRAGGITFATVVLKRGVMPGICGTAGCRLLAEAAWTWMPTKTVPVAVRCTSTGLRINE